MSCGPDQAAGNQRGFEKSRLRVGAIALVLLIGLLEAQALASEESLRISRPKFVMPESMRFSVGREKLFSDQFRQWRKQYCHPVVCPDITCAGSCSVYTDSCPSFTGLTVFDLRNGSATLLTGNGCSSQCADDGGPSTGESSSSVQADCCHQ
jgi:hypothetical protein